jgi:anti-sigma regulatory factor (Ser/Thr protein kinase)
VEDLVDAVVAACDDGGGRRDDLAVLALRDEPAGARRLRVLVPAAARELAGVRRALRSFLGGLGVPDLTIDAVVLASSEAATNAIEHAYLEPYAEPGMVGITVEVDGAVHVEVRDAGRWKDLPSATNRGRGLTIARTVMDAVRVYRSPSGTTVSLTTGIEPPTDG